MKTAKPTAPKGYTKNFSRALEEELAKNKSAKKPPIHFFELAAMSGVPGSTLSRIRRGIQRCFRMEDIESIISTVSVSPEVRGRLVAAWLRDQNPFDGLVEIRTTKGKVATPLFTSEVQAAFDYLRTLRRGDVEAFILYTARLAGFDAEHR
jgi:hypothetical protein